MPGAGLLRRSPIGSARSRGVRCELARVGHELARDRIVGIASVDEVGNVRRDGDRVAGADLGHRGAGGFGNEALRRSDHRPTSACEEVPSCRRPYVGIVIRVLIGNEVRQKMGGDRVIERLLCRKFVNAIDVRQLGLDAPLQFRRDRFGRVESANGESDAVGRFVGQRRAAVPQKPRDTAFDD